jgi:3-oxoacyl-[acyl-carrier protein] reductase
MKTVLVTGASRGIGEAIACRFASEGGWNIIINCCSIAAALEKVKIKIESAGSPCLASVGDVSDESYIKSLFEAVSGKFGGLDVLVGCAGIDRFGVLQDTSLEEWNRVMAVNLTGNFLLAREAIPMMLEKKAGSILFISSVYGRSGASCEAAYSASKGGLNALTLSLSKELAPSGIRVNALLPGAIDTEMNARLSADERRALEEEIPLGRMGTPEEVAELAFATAVKYPYMTGGLISLNGGWE